ncbi:MAG: YbaB/EbfC family nucleoid-associated protein [Alphaproteobacteria bacterium]|nr:YbaB/EbfC family nucleoid-associated protein [Alphaproteobacteria bacterium]
MSLKASNSKQFCVEANSKQTKIPIKTINKNQSLTTLKRKTKMFNMQGLMKQAQMMQKKMQEEQAKLATKEISGNSANGLVSVTLNGKSEMKKISIDKSLITADDTEMLEDLIMVAYNNAHNKVEELTEESMKTATGGVNLGGLKLPF